MPPARRSATWTPAAVVRITDLALAQGPGRLIKSASSEVSWGRSARRIPACRTWDTSGLGPVGVRHRSGPPAEQERRAGRQQTQEKRNADRRRIEDELDVTTVAGVEVVASHFCEANGPSEPSAFSADREQVLRATTDRRHQLKGTTERRRQGTQNHYRGRSTAASAIPHKPHQALRHANGSIPTSLATDAPSARARSLAPRRTSGGCGAGISRTPP